MPHIDFDDYLSIEDLRADVRERAVRGGAYTLTAQACKIVLQLGSTVLLARLLVPEDFGLVVMVIVSLVNQLLLADVFAGQHLLSFASCGVSIVLYLGIGVLAGLFLAPPRTAGDGAKAGALAGLIAAVVSVPFRRIRAWPKST